MSETDNTTSPSSAQIEAQLRVARDHRANLEDEVYELSLPAVGGNAEAAAALANVQAQIHQVSADILVLENAKVSAIGKELAAAQTKTAEYRARNLAIAKERAAALVELAGQADDAVAALIALLARIGTEERAIWNALRAASVPPSECIFGRKNLAQFAMERAQLSASGKALFHSDQRSIAEIARAAWSELVEPSDAI